MNFRPLAAAALALAAAALAVGLAPVATASASPPGDRAEHGAVFVETNDETSNAIIAYSRGRDGHLTETGRFPAGGLGGAVAGPVFDPLASQGALTYDADHQLLYAVNAGSDTLTVFAVHGTNLSQRQIVSSGGHLPVSVGVARDLVYVLNAGGDGAISGFRVNDGTLNPLVGSTRSLGLGNPATPPFLAAPSQVALTPDGRNVIVATKTQGVLDIFPLDRLGRPTPAPVVTAAAPGSVPFALSFDRDANLLVAGAAGVASSYTVHRDGTLTAISTAVPNGQSATCWTVFARGHLYAANAGSATITGYTDHHGKLALREPTGVAAHTDTGPVDLAASGDDKYLYQLATGAGVIDEYRIGQNGSLSLIGTVTGLGIDNGHGAEGIAAT